MDEPINRSQPGNAQAALGIDPRDPHQSPSPYLDNRPSIIIVYVGKFGSSNAPSNPAQCVVVQQGQARSGLGVLALRPSFRVQGVGANGSTRGALEL
jgi:hypothetical protein